MERCGQPLISVVVPVYNVERYLDKCLSSIIGQSFTEFELIVVNDGSPDGSQKIIDAYAERCPDKVVSVRKDNGGLSSARNAGMKEARGKYLAFIDGDDYIGKDYLAALWNTARETDADMIIGGGFVKVDENGSVIETVIFPGDGIMFRVRSAWGALYKTETVRAASIEFPPGCNYEDNYFNMAMDLVADKIAVAGAYDYYYVQRGGSLMTTELKKVDDSWFPYDYLTELFRKSSDENYAGNKAFEYAVIRFFTAVIFVRGRGADREVLRRLCGYAKNSLAEFFPGFYKNPHLNILKHKNVPLSERAGIWLFAQLCRFGALDAFAVLYNGR